MQSIEEYVLFKMINKQAIATEQKNENSPTPSSSILSFLFFSSESTHLFHSVHPPSVFSILTVQVHRDLLHTLLHTFCIKPRYFTIICAAFILSNYSHQTIRKSRKIKHLSHFQAHQESHGKAPACELNKFLLVLFHIKTSKCKTVK